MITGARGGSFKERKLKTNERVPSADRENHMNAGLMQKGAELTPLFLEGPDPQGCLLKLPTAQKVTHESEVKSYSSVGM